MTLENEFPAFYTINEFAERLKVHPNTIRRQIKKEKIITINIGTGKKKLYRIPSSEVQRLVLCDLKKLFKMMNEQKELL